MKTSTFYKIIAGYFIALACLASYTCNAQLNSTFKAAESLNADSTTVRNYLKADSMANRETGWFYFNNQSNKWRIGWWSTGQAIRWRDLLGGGGSTVNVGPVDNRILRANVPPGNVQNSLVGINDSGIFTAFNGSDQQVLALGSVAASDSYFSLVNGVTGSAFNQFNVSNGNGLTFNATNGFSFNNLLTINGPSILTPTAQSLTLAGGASSILTASSNANNVYGSPINITTGIKGVGSTTGGSGAVNISTGNVQGGTGNSGDINISTGTVSGGTAGSINIEVPGNSEIAMFNGANQIGIGSATGTQAVHLASSISVIDFDETIPALKLTSSDGLGAGQINLTADNGIAFEGVITTQINDLTITPSNNSNINLSPIGQGDILLTVSSGATRYLMIFGLPTSSVGLPSGAVWSNAGVLTIVP